MANLDSLFTCSKSASAAGQEERGKAAEGGGGASTGVGLALVSKIADRMIGQGPGARVSRDRVTGQVRDRVTGQQGAGQVEDKDKDRW